MLNERSHLQRTTCCRSPFTGVSRVDKSIEIESRLVDAWGWGVGKWRIKAEVCEVSFRADEMF